MIRLAELSHPSGVRFSPYSSVPERARVLLPSTLPAALADPRKFVWGEDNVPIEMTFAQYFSRYVWDRDYSQGVEGRPEQPRGAGCGGHCPWADNADQLYPRARVVEIHVPEILPGTYPAQFGCEWRSLRIWFEQDRGRWRLVALVHHEP